MSEGHGCCRKKKLQHRGEGKPQNREWRTRATLTFLTAWVWCVSRHPQAHCFARIQGNPHPAIVLAKIYYSDAARYTSSNKRDSSGGVWKNPGQASSSSRQEGAMKCAAASSPAIQFC